MLNTADTPYTTFFVDYLLSDEKPIFSGLFSFVAYDWPKKIFAMRQFENYKSRHGAIDLFVKSTFRRLSPEGSNPSPNHFFQPAKPQAICGGEILLTKGEDNGSSIAFANFRSGAFTRQDTVFFDISSLVSHDIQETHQMRIQEALRSLGLPPERYITIEQAKQFEEYYLHDCFHPNGQFIDTINHLETAHKICQGLGQFIFRPKQEDQIITEISSLTR